jgi:HSP20 family protein
MKARRSQLANVGDNEASIGGPSVCRLFRMPSMDMYESEAEYRLFLDMSGVAKEDLAVTLEGHIIRIEARAAMGLAPQCRPLRVEFVAADYLREIALGRGVDPEKIQARLNDGVLELMLPKSKTAAGKKIAVEAMER